MVSLGGRLSVGWYSWGGVLSVGWWVGHLFCVVLMGVGCVGELDCSEDVGVASGGWVKGLDGAVFVDCVLGRSLVGWGIGRVFVLRGRGCGAVGEWNGAGGVGCRVGVVGGGWMVRLLLGGCGGSGASGSDLVCGVVGGVVRGVGGCGLVLARSWDVLMGMLWVEELCSRGVGVVVAVDFAVWMGSFWRTYSLGVWVVEFGGVVGIGMCYGLRSEGERRGIALWVCIVWWRKLGGVRGAVGFVLNEVGGGVFGGVCGGWLEFGSLGDLVGGGFVL
ncbi:hypothetical protein Tco_0191220 [Tanacetum coccineum]